MAVIAGYIQFNTLSKKELHYINQLATVFNQYRKADVHRYDCDNGAIFQYDFDAYQQASWLQTESQIATLIGHPLLTSSRSDDLQTMAKTTSLSTCLQQCEGVFSFCQFNSQLGTLVLATDPLGLKPFYTLKTECGLFFSTNLNLFKQLSIKLESDAEALTELAVLGYPLLDHTPYKKVKCSYPGEILRFDALHGVIKQKYFDWVMLAKQDMPIPDAIAGVTQAFQSVVSKAIYTDKKVLSTLSGGLDSRLINCELLRQGVQLKSFNFSKSDSQDLYCAKQYASQNALELEVIQVHDTQKLSVEQRLGKHWRKAKHNDYKTVSRPQISWSGNGGSVGLGAVFYGDNIYAAAKENDLDKLIQAYLEQQYAYLPKSVVHNANQLQQKLIDNLKLSFKPLAELPLVKAFQLFLLLNDQHHHLSIPNEKVCEFKMEFFHPFYSWKVLQYPLAVPVEYVRRHGFYQRWLKTSYPRAMLAPWQAYPGHIPCPIKVDYQSQWQLNNKNLMRFNELFKLWYEIMRFDRHQLIKRSHFTALCLLQLTHLKNAQSNIRIAQRFCQW
ncbi:asparagine synthase [Pseudoalteromonas sp. CO302Y]|uniref:asparagine synthase-related protein n=1 Tax=unclassified Pseudoalteromonas TaxID=194690 RepID=UPI001023017F|nr:asparagine synthase [Pseudoalteromonas sp. CO302Y]RZG07971.1 asparagine synthase [Pseudoalteromonas sp. CO133X]